MESRAQVGVWGPVISLSHHSFAHVSKQGEVLGAGGAAGWNATQNKPQVNFETGGSLSCPGEGLASAGALRR